MSHTHSPSTRDVRRFLKKTTAHLTGKTERGPDWSEEPGYRVPHAGSLDVNDPKARVFAPIGDGSKGAGLAFVEATLQALRELFHLEYQAVRPSLVRDRVREHAALSAEFAALIAPGAPKAAPGRLAALRLRIGELAPVVQRARMRPQRLDIEVMRALLAHLDFGTGKLFPTWETIAATAGCCRTSVFGALRRLKHHGFISWVRRSIRTSRGGVAGPQREQTSNAYFFEHRDRMAPGVWQRLKQRLDAKLRRLRPAAPPPDRPAAIAEIKDPALRATIAALGAGVRRASS